jgi:hypothetical protein
MELMRIKPAAKRLKIDPQTLRRRINERGWPTYSLGPKSLLVDIDEILRLTRNEKRQAQRSKN